MQNPFNLQKVCLNGTDVNWQFRTNLLVLHCVEGGKTSPFNYKGEQIFEKRKTLSKVYLGKEMQEKALRC